MYGFHRFPGTTSSNMQGTGQNITANPPGDNGDDDLYS